MNRIRYTTRYRSALPVTPAVIRGRTLFKLFKNFHKVFFIRETAGICGFFYAEVIVGKQLFGRLDAQTIGIGDQREPNVPFKQGGKIISLITDGICQFFHEKRAAVIGVDPVAGGRDRISRKQNSPEPTRTSRMIADEK